MFATLRRERATTSPPPAVSYDYRSSNGADGISDIEGKATRVGAREWSRGDASDIDGQTERSKWAGHMSQRGQRTSFNPER